MVLNVIRLSDVADKQYWSHIYSTEAAGFRNAMQHTETYRNI